MEQQQQPLWVGEVFVDSGTLWLGDPCYVMGSDATHAPGTWNDYLDKVLASGQLPPTSCPLGEGVGVQISTGNGDGRYPVTATFTDDGRVASVTVTFIPTRED